MTGMNSEPDKLHVDSFKVAGFCAHVCVCTHDERLYKQNSLLSQQRNFEQFSFVVLSGLPQLDKLTIVGP